MERDEAIQYLPETYKRLLALLDEGCSHEEIARRLDLDASETGPLVDLARAKLARLIGREQQP